MTAISLPGWFNVSSATISQIDGAQRQERYPAFLSSILRLGIELTPVSFLKLVAHSIANWLVVTIDEKATNIASRALLMEAMKEQMILDLARGLNVPLLDLIAQIESFEKAHDEFILQCEKNIKAFRELNSSSRVAASFERMREAAMRVGAAISGIKDVAVQTTEAGPVINKIKSLNTFIDDRLEHYGDDFDPDPEMLALADEAIKRIQSRTEV